MQHRPLPILFVRLALLALALVLVISSTLPVLAGSRSASPSGIPIPSTPIPGSSLHLPVLVGGGPPSFVLQKAWTSNTQNVQQGGFLAGAGMQYHLTGANNHTWAEDAHILWTRQDSCGNVSTVFSDTVTLPSGAWEHMAPSTAPNCTGVVTTTVELTHRAIVYPLTTHYVVGTSSSVIIDNHQGFDRCTLPEVSEMQTWWDNSPYWVFNLYIGGSSFACRNDPVYAAWVHQVALQGWNFILTWVGPQAPCSRWSNKMSSNATTAYNQGRAEADAAATAANNLGFLGNMVIYYDLENYATATDACRNTTKQFIRGWVERLHERGLRAGAYGGSYASYVSDWATITPMPDDVWLARWFSNPYYRPNASVWDDPYVSNLLWPNHQRLRQYAGGHTETWGGVSQGIDSNVLDGHITSLLSLPVSRTLSGPTSVIQTGPALQRAGIVSSAEGWLLADGRLLWTGDTGQSWQEISPALNPSSIPLDAAFTVGGSGWLALQTVDPDGSAAIQVQRRTAAGWDAPTRLSLTGDEAAEVADAYLETSPDGALWLGLKLQSSSSFSAGRLFASLDGGATWHERSLPIGGRAHFSDARNGWVAGGTTGSEYYTTRDGGVTWIAAAALPVQPARALPPNAVQSDFAGDLNGWAIVQDNACQGDKSAAAVSGQPFTCTRQDRLFTTRDGGASWTEITP